MAGSTQAVIPSAMSTSESQNTSSRDVSSCVFSSSDEFVEAKTAWKRAVRKSAVLAIAMAERATAGTRLNAPNVMERLRGKLPADDEITNESLSDEEGCLPRARMRRLLCCGGGYKRASIEAPSDVEASSEAKEERLEKKALFPVQRTEPVDPAVSAIISERVKNQVLDVRKQTLARRVELKTAAKRQEESVHFPKTLEKLKILFLVTKVKLMLGEVNMTSGEGEYKFGDDLQQFTFGKSVRRSATTLTVTRPKAGSAWKAKFKNGSGRAGMEVYAEAVLKVISWEFFGQQDTFKTEGVEGRFLPTGEEICELAMASSIGTLTFNFLQS